MLSNAYFLAKFRFGTAENEPAKSLQNLANFPNFANLTPATEVMYGSKEDPDTARRVWARTRLFRGCQAACPALAFVIGSVGWLPVFGKFRQNVARFRLYRHRFLQENTRFAAFFKIYQIFKLKFLKSGQILQILQHLQKCC